SVVKEVTQFASMDHRFIAAWNPRCDGKVERKFGVYNDVSKKLTQGADRYWPQFVPGIQLYLNSMLSSLTKSSAFSLIFARDSNIPSAFPATGETVGTVPHPIRSL